MAHNNLSDLNTSGEAADAAAGAATVAELDPQSKHLDFNGFPSDNRETS